MDLDADIECPSCKRKIKVKLKTMIPNSNRMCPHCHSKVTFSGDDGRKAQQAINDFEKSLKKLF